MSSAQGASTPIHAALTVCTRCFVGFYKAIRSTTSTKTDSCTPHTKCLAGKTAGSVTTSPAGFFKLDTSASSVTTDSCIDHAKCPAGGCSGHGFAASQMYVLASGGFKNKIGANVQLDIGVPSVSCVLIALSTDDAPRMASVLAMLCGPASFVIFLRVRSAAHALDAECV